MVFVLDEQSYALYLPSVERVVRAVEVTPLPKAPDIVSGIINLRGKITPVVDLRGSLSAFRNFLISGWSLPPIQGRKACGRSWHFPSARIGRDGSKDVHEPWTFVRRREGGAPGPRNLRRNATRLPGPETLQEAPYAHVWERAFRA